MQALLTSAVAALAKESRSTFNLPLQPLFKYNRKYTVWKEEETEWQRNSA